MLLPPNALKLSLSELLALKQKSWTLHSIYIYTYKHLLVYSILHMVIRSVISYYLHDVVIEKMDTMFFLIPPSVAKKYHSSPSPFLQTANVSFGIQTRIYTDTGCCSSLSVYVYEGLFKKNNSILLGMLVCRSESIFELY